MIEDGAEEEATRFVRSFCDCLERFDADGLAAFLDDEVVHVEHPNLLVPGGVTRDKAGMLAGLRAGAKTLAKQRYEVSSVIASKDRIAFEARWTGTLAIPLKAKAAGEDVEASFAVFFSLRGGRVVRWTNYDCFPPL